LPRTCVDASLVLLWLLPEELSLQADSLRERWLAEGTQLVAPPLLLAEVPSTLRQAIYRRRITPEEGKEAFTVFLDLELQILQPDGLLTRAWELGGDFNAPRLYDFFYVALAELIGCPLWTADRRLVSLVERRCPWVHWLGEVIE